MFTKKSQTQTPSTTSSNTTTTQNTSNTAETPPSKPVSPARPANSPFPLKGTSAMVQKESENKPGSRLHVGKDIHLKGEITACDRLIVEGTVEASMNSKEIDISESGIFEGEVTIDTAEISGKFEGTLTARKKLIIHKTGSVNGTIRYGEIEIETGGKISGQFEQQLEDTSKKSMSA